ncbi:MAG: enoyl-CoA hydratase/isomerase family protein [Acidimicrobiales bacterium]
MSSGPVLARAKEGPVVIATLNRPAKANAVNREVLSALEDLAAEIEADWRSGRSRALVLAGAGTKAFSAGADIAELAGLDREAAHRQMRRGQAVFGRLEQLPVAVVAAIDGYALGGGLELAMAADLRVATPRSRFGQPEINLANLPGWGGTQRLPRLVGLGRAKELVLSGELIGAQRAYEIGLVNQLADDALQSALRLASTLAARSPAAVAGAKRSLHIGLSAGFDAGLAAEAEAAAGCCQTEAQRAAVRAFLGRASQ